MRMDMIRRAVSVTGGKASHGFTLVEILLAMALGMIVLAAIFIAVQSGQRASGAIDAKTSAQQDVNATLELMTLEISMASFDPRQSVFPPPNRGILEATPTSLRFQADLNMSGAIDAPNEDIRYEYVTTAGDQYITRATSGGAGQPFLGETIASGRTRVVRVINNSAAVNIPVFRYFDGRGTELPALPANIPNIRRVDITIAVETDAVDPNTGQRRSMTYSTSVVPRNHVLFF